MEYYQKCVARSAVLNNVLTSPSKVKIMQKQQEFDKFKNCKQKTFKSALNGI